MTENYIKLFETNKELLESLLPLGGLRDKAMKDFKRLGFPGSKMEKWRNFELRELKSEKYEVDNMQDDLKMNFFSLLPDIKNTDLLVLHNGLASYDNQIKTYKNGIIFGSLRAALNKYPSLVKKYFNKANIQNQNGFNALNTAFSVDGFFLFVPENVIVDKPFAVIQLLQRNKRAMISMRNVIIVEKNASTSIVQIENSDKDDSQFVNNATEVFLENGSSLNWDTMQKYEGTTTVINPVFIVQKEGTSLKKSIVTIGGRKIRNDIHAKLTGKNGKSDISGMYILNNRDMVENRVFIDHKVSHCDSNQLFRGILDGKSRGAFTGYVLVRQDAQKTNAFQSNKNIVVSDEAKINTNPFLEIYADDVKCSHGASVGSLDQEAIFYLRARGIEKKKAEDILLLAFAMDALENIGNEEYREFVRTEIEKTLNID